MQLVIETFDGSRYAVSPEMMSHSSQTTVVWVPPGDNFEQSSRETFIAFGTVLVKTYSHNRPSTDEETRLFLNHLIENNIRDTELLELIEKVLMDNPQLHFPQFLSFDRRMDLMCEEAMHRIERAISIAAHAQKLVFPVNAFAPLSAEKLSLAFSSEMLPPVGGRINLHSILIAGDQTIQLQGSLKIFAEKGITLDVPDGQRIDLAPRPITIAKTTFLQRLYRLTVLGPYRTLRWLVTGDIK